MRKSPQASTSGPDQTFFLGWYVFQFNLPQPDRQTFFSSSFVTTFNQASPLDVLEVLHWGEGSAITLHRKLNPHQPDEQWQDLGAIMLPELRAKWPLIAEHLGRDSYFSINSTYEQTRSTEVSGVTGLPIYSRKAERLSWLNSIVLDLDMYKLCPNCSSDQLREAFAREIDRNGLPYPNVICLSGRGIWGLWLLRDHMNPTPVPAFPDRRDIYKRINRAMVERFVNLGADRSAVDPSRVMRIPGSINTDAAQENSLVRFFRWSNDFHTLPELGDLLGVRAQAIGLPGESTRQKNQARVNAGLVRWRNPLDGFRRLWNIRGHFSKGVRHNTLYVLAYLLRRNRVVQAEVLNECLRLARSCRPALTSEDVKRCVSSSTKTVYEPFERSISNATIARMLRITMDEKAHLQAWFKPKRRRKSAEIAERHLVIMRELQLAGTWVPGRELWISTREMAWLLFGRYGIKASHVTVAKDYRILYQRHFAGSQTVNSSVLVDLPLSLCTNSENLTAAELTQQGTNQRGAM